MGLTTDFDERLLGVGFTDAEAELALNCEAAVTLPDAWATLNSLGIPGPAITGAGDGYFASIHVAAVVPLPENLFEFAHNLTDQTGAKVAFVVPMLDEIGRTQSFVACNTQFTRATRWRRTLAMLGMEGLLAPRIAPLRVFRTVIDWLRADRDGLVIFDFPLAAERLCRAEALAVDDVAFGRELSEKLHIGPPRILVRASERAAA